MTGPLILVFLGPEYCVCVKVLLLEETMAFPRDLTPEAYHFVMRGHQEFDVTRGKGWQMVSWSPLPLLNPLFPGHFPHTVET